MYFQLVLEPIIKANVSPLTPSELEYREIIVFVIMASEAAVGYALYEVAETAVEIGIGAYFVAVPTVGGKTWMPAILRVLTSIDDALNR